MGTNTTVLIVVVALAALVLAGVLAGVLYQTRTPHRGEVVRDQADEDSLRRRRQEVLADEYAARAHAARVEIDIKTMRACRLEELATMQRRAAARGITRLPAPVETRIVGDNGGNQPRPRGSP
jgi:hypothetical protein